MNDENVKDLNQESFNDSYEQPKDEILQIKVDFQGINTDLNALISLRFPLPESLPLFDLFKKNQFKIGEAIPITNGYDPDCYIDRTFNKYTRIHSDIFVDKNKAIYTDFLAETEEEFEELCLKHPDENVHLLGHNEFGVIWRKTHGRLSNLRNYILNSDSTKVYSTDELIQEAITEKVMIIADVAGAGKTTVLTHLSKIIKRRNPTHWVVRINLSNCTTELKEKAYLHLFDSEAAIDFLIADLIKIGNDLEKAIFKSLLEEEKIILMFDEFDEISARHKVIVMRLLEVLKETSVQQLWVTTRPQLRADLEEKLQRIAYNFEEFTDQNQIEFLTKFWRKSLKSNEIDEEKIEGFSRKLVEIATSNDKDITGVPLQSYMLAEGFVEEFQEFYFGDNYNLPNRLDLMELYVKYLNGKYRYILEQNNGIEAAGNNISEINLRKIHQYLAMKVLIPEREELLLENQKFCHISNGDLSRIGIANVDDNKIDFVHRIFAEYYVSDFLAEELQKETDFSKKIQKIILEDVLLIDKFQIVRLFLNNFLKKIILPQEILNEYAQRVKETLSSLTQPEVYPELEDYDLTIVSTKNFEYEEDDPWGYHQNIYRRKFVPNTVSLRIEEESVIEIWGHKKYYIGTGGHILHHTLQENNRYITYFLLNIFKDPQHKDELKRLLLYRNYDGQTVWYGAVLIGDQNMLKELWDAAKKAELDQEELKQLLIACDQSRWSSWHWIIKNNNMNLLDKLLEFAKEINLNLKDDFFLFDDVYGRTVWCWAVQFGSVDTIDKLWRLAMEEKCEKDLFSYENVYKDMWRWAMQNNGEGILGKLWELKNDAAYISAIWHETTENGDLDLLEKLWTSFHERNLLHCRNSKGKSAWMLATEHNKKEVLDKLLGWAKDDEEIKELVLAQDNNGETAFLIATGNNCEDMLEYQWNVAVQKCVQAQILLREDQLGQIAWYKTIWMGRMNLLEKIWKYADDTKIDKIRNIDDMKDYFLRSERKGDFTVWYAAVQSNNVEILSKIRELTQEHLSERNTPSKREILKRLQDSLLTKNRFAGVHIWKKALNVGLEMFETLWIWIKELPEICTTDLKEVFLKISLKKRNIWHEMLTLQNRKVELLEKSLSFSEQANLTPIEFKTAWLTKDNSNRTPLDILGKNYKNSYEREVILDVIEKHYFKINGSLEGLLNELSKFAIVHSYRDRIAVYLSKGADVTDPQLLYKIACKKNWYVVIMLMRFGGNIENLNSEQCNLLKEYIQRNCDDDQNELLEKIEEVAK